MTEEKRLAREYFNISEEYRIAGDYELCWIAFSIYKHFKRIHFEKMERMNKKSA